MTLCAVLHSLLLPPILPQFFTHSSQFPKRNYSAKIKKKGLSLALFALTDLRTAPPACPGTAPETGYLEQQTQAFRSLACERTCQASALQRPPRLQDATLELVYLSNQSTVRTRRVLSVLDWPVAASPGDEGGGGNSSECEEEGLPLRSSDTREGGGGGPK